MNKAIKSDHKNDARMELLLIVIHYTCLPVCHYRDHDAALCYQQKQPGEEGLGVQNRSINGHQRHTTRKIWLQGKKPRDNCSLVLMQFKLRP